jgi:hypothetical protein
MLPARQAHCLISGGQQVVELLLQRQIRQPGACRVVDEQTQQPPVLTKGEPHQAIRVVDLGAQRSGGTTAFIARGAADSS